MKFYKFLLRFIPIFIVLVVLPRVASFVGLIGNNAPGFDLHDIIRFAFAASLGLGTIATAYFSDETEPPEYDDEPNNARERKRREREAIYFAAMLNAAPYARGAMILFAFLDGTFNLADAFYGATGSGLLDPTMHGQIEVYLYGAATFLFGVSPTILAIVLSRVNSMVDRIPVDYERPANKRQVDLLRTVMGNLGLQEFRYSDAERLTSPADHNLPDRSNRTNGHGQTERIIAYLDARYANDPTEFPTIPEIQEALQPNPPAKSTVSEVRSRWLASFERT